MKKHTPKVIRVHFNKHLPFGRPWTAHYAGMCLYARTIEFRVPVTSEWKPKRKSNPRAFMRCEGFVHMYSGGRFVIDNSAWGQR